MGVIYRYKCDQVDCDKEYIVGSLLGLRKRLKEHLRAPFPICDHGNTSGHCISVDNFSIVSMETHDITRTIKESMYIRVNDPSLNSNIGSSNWLTFGMRSCKTTLSLVLRYQPLSCALQWAHTGSHTVCITPILESMVLHQGGVKPPLWYDLSPFTHPLVPSVVSIILVIITFFFRLDEAMLFLAWQKFVCTYKYFLFNAIYKEFSYLYLIPSMIAILSMNGQYGLVPSVPQFLWMANFGV